MTDRTDPPAAQSRLVACPRCNGLTQVEAMPGWQAFACATCAATSSLLAARVRASRSQGDKRGGARFYATRVVYAGTEDLIEFPAGYEAFEMRAGDEVAFVARGGRLYIVHNFTLRRMARLRPPFGIRWKRVLLVVVGVAILVALVAMGGYGLPR